MTVFTCGETLHYQSISTFWTSYVCFCLRKKERREKKRELTKARNDVKTKGHKVNKRA
jgi:hypothetical protein